MRVMPSPVNCIKCHVHNPRSIKKQPNSNDNVENCLLLMQVSGRMKQEANSQQASEDRAVSRF